MTLAPIPESTAPNLFTPVEKKKAWRRRTRLVKAIGAAAIPAFEKWAFHAKTPMIYDTRIGFLWNCIHSKRPFDGTPDEILAKIIEIWKSFDEDSQ